MFFDGEGLFGRVVEEALFFPLFFFFTAGRDGVVVVVAVGAVVGLKNIPPNKPNLDGAAVDGAVVGLLLVLPPVLDNTVKRKENKKDSMKTCLKERTRSTDSLTIITMTIRD